MSSSHDAKPTDDRITELEHRIQALELQIRRSETECTELAREARTAREGQRLAEDTVRARDEILGVVAHDLRNPLGTIMMGATALVQLGGAGDAGSSRIRSVAERIERQAARMARQLVNLTDFAEAQAGRLTIERTPHAARAIVVATAELVGPGNRERGIALETNAAAELPPVDCDHARVVQALANLCGNAAKVTPNGGVIEIGARAGAGARVEFFVRDHGPGIDRDDIMFEPSWRSEQPGYKGAGLGFAIARGIVEAHGGRIWAETRPGAGTAVYFSLAPGD